MTEGLVLLPALAVTSIFVGLTWAVLRRKRTRGGVWPGRLAWALVALFALACVFLVSFGGMYALAVCWLLALAAAFTPRAGQPTR